MTFFWLIVWLFSGVPTSFPWFVALAVCLAIDIGSWAKDMVERVVDHFTEKKDED